MQGVVALWLMLALGLSVTVDGVTDGYARYGLLASPGAVPAVAHLRALGDTFAESRLGTGVPCAS